MNKLTRQEFDALVALTKGNLPAGEDAETLVKQGWMADGTITDAGYAALEPYKARRVIFLAAGFGSRLRPATLSVPKPLVRVHGRPIICSAIDAAIAAGIQEIIIVRGYLGEVFDQLLSKYPQVRLVDNPLYTESNNISSALQVCELMQNAYVMEADLLIENPAVFRTYNYTSNCLGVPVEKTADWCVVSEGGVAKALVKGGEACHHLFSIYYMTQEDGANLPGDLRALFEREGGKDCFWDMAPMNVFNSHYHIEVVECSFSDITEIDTYEELTQVDPDYKL